MKATVWRTTRREKNKPGCQRNFFFVCFFVKKGGEYVKCIILYVMC